MASKRRSRERVSAREHLVTGSAVELAYFSPERFDAARQALDGRLLGAIAFGADRPDAAAPDCPYAWVDMPVLGHRSAVFEVWTSEQPVVRDDVEGLAAARNDEVLFGCVEIEPQASLDA